MPKKLLYIKASPREERCVAQAPTVRLSLAPLADRPAPRPRYLLVPRSISAKLGDSFLAGYLEKHPGAEVDTIQLWDLDMPEFDGDAAAAKVSFFGALWPALTGMLPAAC